MRVVIAPLLALACMSTGCHVVERSKHCGWIAGAMHDAAPELNATKIPDDPSSKVLRKKARLFGQLHDQLKKIHPRDPKVRAEKQAVVEALATLEKNFKETAEAVDEQAKFVQRQQAVRERAKKRANDPASAKKPPSEPSTKPPVKSASNPELSAKAKTKGKAKGQHLGRTSLPHQTNFKGKGKPPSLHSTVHSRRYSRLKRVIDTTTASLGASRKRLEKACR